MNRTTQITREDFRARMLSQTGIDIDAWIILLNKKKHDAGETVISGDLRSAVQNLHGGTVKKMVVGLQDLDKFQLSPKQRAQWNKGIAVLTKFGVFEQVEARPAAGQPETDTEWQVKDVLATTVFMATEYIAQLVKLQPRGGVQLTKEARLDKAVDALTGAWSGFLFADGEAPVEASDADLAARQTHLSSLRSRGRRKEAWGQLFAPGVTPRDLVKHDQQRLAQATSAGRRDELWFWHQCVASLLVYQASAKRRRQTIAQISDTIERRGQEHPGQREAMVHGLPTRPHIADVLPAVYAGVVPESALVLYLHLQTFAQELDAVAALGCLGRGVAITLSTERVAALRSILHDLSEPEDDVIDTEKDALRLSFLRRAMFQLYSLETWHAQLAQTSSKPDMELTILSPRAVPS